MIQVYAAQAYDAPTRLVVSAARLQNGLLWLTGASSSLLFFEPSLYEVASLVTIITFAATGLRFRASVLPLAIALVLINCGYTISASELFDARQPVLTWVLTSWYLAATGVFFALAMQENTEARIDALVRGYMVAAVIASMAGILGYFRLLPSAEGILLEFGRARATFKDPNVFGAFMVFPTLVAMQRVVTGSSWQAIRAGLLCMLFGAGILLSFSRGAWGQLIFTAALTLALMFLTARSARRRTRIVATALAILAAGALGLMVLLSFDVVANLFAERANVLQSYDVGEEGRFARHALGALLALDRPLGIGPLQFATIFPEDPHNSYLNAFMSGGWLAGIAYVTLILVTLLYGLRYVFTVTPWQQTYILVFAAFAGTAFESAIIDSDHWRHYFLLMGVLWGLMSVRLRPIETRIGQG